MSDLIADYNFASRLSDYYRQGTLAFVVMRDLLTERGFYAITKRGESVVARMPSGLRVEL